MAGLRHPLITLRFFKTFFQKSKYFLESASQPCYDISISHMAVCHMVSNSQLHMIQGGIDMYHDRTDSYFPADYQFNLSDFALFLSVMKNKRAYECT